MGKRKDPSYSFDFGPEEYDPWWDQAKCLNHPHPDYWFADNKSTADEAAYARAVCSICPVASRCFSYAMSHPEVEGIWAGTTFQERRVARKGGKVKNPNLCARQLHPRAKQGAPRKDGWVRCLVCERDDKRAKRAKERQAA